MCIKLPTKAPRVVQHSDGPYGMQADMISHMYWLAPIQQALMRNPVCACTIATYAISTGVMH